MNEFWIMATIFGVIFALETLFPFTRESRGRDDRLRANTSLLLITALVGFLFGPLTALVLQANGKAWAGIAGTAQSLFFCALIFVLYDAWMYGWHRLNHRVPFFWRFHQVHHSDHRMDATTAFRFHPGEIILSNILNLFIFAVLGMSAPLLLAYKIFFWIVIIFHHSNTALPLKADQLLRSVIVTPFLHRVHHSPWQPETDSNYGSILSCWDRLFRSYRVRDQIANVVFGLDTLGVNRILNAKEALLLPLRQK
jgi:sterol desaturase/sphingolipid hydroxylase (fatty acid hydroxylase superfamily)